MVKKIIIPAITTVTYVLGSQIGPITSNTTITINTPYVLVVAVGGGGAGGGTGGSTVQGGNGGNTVVTNGSQTITAGGGQGGWSGNYNGFGGTVCVGCAYGPGGNGGTGSVEGLKYYQIVNGNAGQNGGDNQGGQGGALPSGYNTAIQQVLQEARISQSISLSIPSTLCTPTQDNSGGSPGSGYGIGGCGNGGASGNGGGGGGSGAIVVGIMNGGTFNITIGQGGQPSSGVTYSCTSCATGLPGIVYLWEIYY